MAGVHMPLEASNNPTMKQITLGYPDASATPEVWADRLLDFHKHYLQENLPETMQGTLGIDANLRNKLCTLVKEIHASLNPRPFKDPLDPSCSFHDVSTNEFGKDIDTPLSGSVNFHSCLSDGFDALPDEVDVHFRV
ncbi:hypothetical protein H2248_001792 [Termitomyces sp. 'cryptogamus']|nr:hypothetical protein H2248_001792 [Termitomyces sp. 'cryptogamus']